MGRKAIPAPACSIMLLLLRAVTSGLSDARRWEQVRIHLGGHGGCRWRPWLQEWPQLCSTQIPGFLPAFEPASPHWCCELSNSLPLLQKVPTVGFCHLQ